MKLFVPVVALVALTLGACQSTSTPVAQSDTRTIDLAGTQSRTTVEVPASHGSDAPYALQGGSAMPTRSPGETGYQAR